MSEIAVLRKPWSDPVRQREAYAFGLWIFLISEVLFFGGMFLGYAVVHHLHPDGVDLGAAHTRFWYGAGNTAILLTSSLTLTIAERASLAHWRSLARLALGATVLLGLAFLAVKGREYSLDIEDRLVPGRPFDAPLQGAELFWSFYWLLTGVHAIHLTVGVILLARLFRFAFQGQLLEHRASVRVTSLYWHFVDTIWVFLFALLYLPGR
ncbi:MAG: cytochrome c oxidase subunit 3 [Caulobacteraceae bacterium]